MAESGIYEIVNLVNGKRYVGSAVDFPKRWAEHRRDLDRSRHHSRPLQRAWIKYGGDTFVFRIIARCDRAELIYREQREFDRLPPEYNCCKKAGSTLGLRHSDESRAKMSAAQRARYAAGKEGNNKGRKYSREICERMAAPKRGKKRGPMPEEVKRKLSEAKRGKPNLKQRGQKRSDETRRKIREARARQVMPLDFGRERARLTDEQVREVRSLRKAGLPGVAIAELFGIGLSLIQRVCRRERYAWVDPGDPPINARRGWVKNPDAQRAILEAHHAATAEAA